MQAEEEAARQEAAQNNQQYTGTGSTATGTYIWPCPSSTYVTSAFGMRDHPLPLSAARTSEPAEPAMSMPECGRSSPKSGPTATTRSMPI